MVGQLCLNNSCAAHSIGHEIHPVVVGEELRRRAAAEADGRRRRQKDLEGEGEDQGVLEDEHLTLSTTARSVTTEELGRRRNRARTAARRIGVVDRFARTAAPQHARLEEEEEDVEAKLPARFNCPGVDGDGGDVAAVQLSSRAWRLGLGLGFCREKGAGREGEGLGLLLSTEQARHGDSGGAVRWRRRGEALGRYRDDDGDAFLKTPLAVLSLFYFISLKGAATFSI